MHSTLFQSSLLNPRAGCLLSFRTAIEPASAKAAGQSNTVLVVERDPDVLKVADHVVDVGPHPDTLGGTIVYEGSDARHLFNGGNRKV
jgi:hypothetical protein